MKNSQSPLQRIGLVLSTSSETFMLIALIGLFSLPFVIASNLEPIVKQSEANKPSVALVIPDESTSQQIPVAVGENTGAQPEVLGAQTSALPLNILPSSTNLRFFDKSQAEQLEKSYSLEIGSNQVFGKISLFTLRNDSPSKQMYKFDAKSISQETSPTQVLFVDNTEYRASEGKLPDYISLETNEEVTFYVMNTERTLTDIKVTVELAELPS